MKIGACIMINEEDCVLWLDQLLRELERMPIEASWYLDHCSDKHKERIRNHQKTVSVIIEDDAQFLEPFRQKPFRVLQSLKYDWIVMWDSDETWEKDAPKTLVKELGEQECVIGTSTMVTAWEKGKRFYLRDDGPFDHTQKTSQTHRVRFYKGDQDWRWLDRITQGPALHVYGERIELTPMFHTKTAIIHWGYSTEELREQHRKRWDNNYVYAIGRNPYGLWDFVCDKNIKPRLIKFPQKYERT